MVSVVWALLMDSDIFVKLGSTLVISFISHAQGNVGSLGYLSHAWTTLGYRNTTTSLPILITVTLFFLLSLVLLK